MINFTKTLRFQLLLLYMITISVLVVIIAGVTPYYYQNEISNRTEVLTKSLIASSRQSLETYIDEMERLTQTPYFDSDAISALRLRSSGEYSTSSTYQKLLADRAIENLMNNYFQNTEAHIVGITLISVDGVSYGWSSYGSSNLKTTFKGSHEAWFRKAIAEQGRPVFVTTHKQDYLIYSDADSVFSVARLIRDPVTLKPLAVIMVDADTNVIDNIIKNAKYDFTSVVSIFDENGKPIFSTEKLPNKFNFQKIKSDNITFNKTDYKIVSSSILTSNWKMVVMFSLSDIHGKSKLMYIMGTLFAVIGLLITMLIFLSYSNHVTKPYRAMISVMEEVKSGNLKARFEACGSNEISKLGNEFNNMLIRINELINEEYKAKLSLRNAEYKALQSQIKPHFLFNTLNGFIALNRLDDRKKLEKSIFSLTGMMRYILGHEDMALVSDEFDFLEDYCQLQQLRFENRLDYHISCDDSINTIRMPKLILQPLVENALIHGIEPADKMCHLEVSGKLIMDGDKIKICFTVSDDGIGFDCGSVIKSTSRGINNVRERLEIAYNDKCSFMLQSEPLIGTKAVITIEV